MATVKFTRTTNMAVAMRNCSIENLVLCTEFISSLKVANLFIGFNKDTIKTDVKQIVCERQSVAVTLNADETEHQLTWTVPMRLLPNTCSRITRTDNGVLLRCNYEDDTNDENEFENASITTKFDRIRCRFCGNDFMNVEAKPVTTRVPMSALGLPAGLNWDHMAISYFCHDHGCGDSGGSSEPEIHDELAPVCIKNSFGPQVSEYFDCETYYVFNDDVLDRKRIRTGDTGVEISCSRCHKRIGESSANSNNLKFYCDAITQGKPFSGTSSDDDDFEMRILANLLRSCESSHRRLLFVNEDRRTLSLLIMDKRLKTIRDRFVAKTTDVNTVWKLLYKPNDANTSQSEVQEQRQLEDSTVKVVDIHQELLSKFISVLTKSTLQLPSTLRSADDYYVAYVPCCN